MKLSRLAACAVALATLLPAPGALAQTPPPVPLDAPGSAAARGERLTIGVQPATGSAPDQRPHFTYGLTAGAVVKDAVAVFNYSAKPVTLTLAARDAITTRSGGLDVQPTATKPSDVGAWIALATTSLTLKPRTRVVVPFQLGLPYDASPGDHTGAIVAALTTTSTGADGRTVQVENRVGLRVYLRVAGAVTRRLELSGVSGTWSGAMSPVAQGDVDVKFTIRNTGNVRLGARSVVRVTDLLGRVVGTRTIADEDVLLPGSVVPVAVTFPSVRGLGRLRATVSVEPLRLEGDAGPVLPAVRSRVSFWAMPWLPFGLLVAAIAGALLWRRARRRRPTGRRRLDVPAPKHAKQHAGAALFTGLALVLVTVVALAAPSFAASGPWAATISPASGADDTPIELTTSGGCPSPAKNVVARVVGPGLPAEGVNVVGNTSANVRPDSAFRVPLVVTLRDVARDQPTPVTLRGRYRIDVVCRTARDPQPLGVYSAAVVFSSPTAWKTDKPVSTVRGPVEPKATGDGTAPGTGSGTASGAAPGTVPGAAAHAPGGAPAPGAPLAAPGAPGTASGATSGTTTGGASGTAPLLLLVAAAIVAAFLLGRRGGPSTGKARP